MGHNGPVRARVIVLAGPSGAGKSRLAERIGLPVLRLDDFYKSGDDPTLPRITDGANQGLVDWDHPDSWLWDDALAALDALCRTGRAEVPIYDIAHDGRCGWQTLDLGSHDLFVAEGIFAQEVVPACRDADLLAAAYCVRQHPLVTFWRRLTRDLRERRKPPLVLVRRGVALLRDQRRVVSHAVERGCEPVTSDEAYRSVQQLRRREVRR
jgi:uridine kinase